MAQQRSAKKKTKSDSQAVAERLSATAAVLKSRIAMLENSFCFRKPQPLQTLATEKKELLAQVEGKLKRLQNGGQ